MDLFRDLPDDLRRRCCRLALRARGLTRDDRLRLGIRPGRLQVPGTLQRRLTSLRLHGAKTSVRVSNGEENVPWFNVCLYAPDPAAGPCRLLYYLACCRNGLGRVQVTWFVKRTACHPGHEAYYDGLTGRQTYCSCMYRPPCDQCDWALRHQA